MKYFRLKFSNLRTSYLCVSLHQDAYINKHTHDLLLLIKDSPSQTVWHFEIVYIALRVYIAVSDSPHDGAYISSHFTGLAMVRSYIIKTISNHYLQLKHTINLEVFDGNEFCG